MGRRLLLLSLIVALGLTACGGETNPSDRVPIVTNDSSSGLTDCEGLHVPVFEQEVNTDLNQQTGILEFSYYDSDAQEDRHFRIAYEDSACQDNPETKRLIDHALDAAG